MHLTSLQYIPQQILHATMISTAQFLKEIYNYLASIEVSPQSPPSLSLRGEKIDASCINTGATFIGHDLGIQRAMATISNVR
jgi:hypothetical protein